MAKKGDRSSFGGGTKKDRPRREPKEKRFQKPPCWLTEGNAKVEGEKDTNLPHHASEGGLQGVDCEKKSSIVPLSKATKMGEGKEKRFAAMRSEERGRLHVEEKK